MSLKFFSDSQVVKDQEKVYRRPLSMIQINCRFFEENFRRADAFKFRRTIEKHRMILNDIAEDTRKNSGSYNRPTSTLHTDRADNLRMFKASEIKFNESLSAFYFISNHFISVALNTPLEWQYNSRLAVRSSRMQRNIFSLFYCGRTCVSHVQRLKRNRWEIVRRQLAADGGPATNESAICLDPLLPLIYNSAVGARRRVAAQRPRGWAWVCSFDIADHRAMTWHDMTRGSRSPIIGSPLRKVSPADNLPVKILFALAPWCSDFYR